MLLANNPAKHSPVKQASDRRARPILRDADRRARVGCFYCFIPKFECAKLARAASFGLCAMGACLSRRASAEVGPERYAPGPAGTAQEEYALVMKSLGAAGRSSAQVLPIIASQYG